MTGTTTELDLNLIPQQERFAGSVAFLVERRDPNHPLATVFVIDSGRVATCASVLAPYEEAPEAIAVYFPALNCYFAVANIRFHPGFDRWKYKRGQGKGQILFPPPAIGAHNVAALQLKTAFQPVSKDVLERLLFTPTQDDDDVFCGEITETNDLAAVLQAVITPGRTAILNICDKRWRPVARLYCEDGRPTHVRFHRLVNENALFQLLELPFPAMFFLQEKDLDTSWCDFTPLSTPLANLLNEASRRKEELVHLYHALGVGKNRIVRRTESFNLQVVPAVAYQYACAMWPTCDQSPLEYLQYKYAFDSYSVLRTVEALYATGHISLEPEVVLDPSHITLSAIPLDTTDTPTKGHRLVCVSTSIIHKRPVLDYGTLLGPLERGDPFRQIMRNPLPPETIGAPVLKNGRVVGIHTGSLYCDSTQEIDTAEMVWIPSLLQCLDTPPKTVKIADLTDYRLEAATAPRQAELPDYSWLDGEDNGTTDQSNLLGSVSSLVSRFFRNPRASEPDWADISIMHTKCGEPTWNRATSATSFQSGDLFKLHMTTIKAGYFYVYYHAHGRRDVQVLYPVRLGSPPKLAAGKSFYIPSADEESFGIRSTITRLQRGLPVSTSGTDSLLVVHTETPLNLPTEVIFKEGMIALNGQPNLKFIELPLQRFTGENSTSANKETIAIAKIRISPRPN